MKASIALELNISESSIKKIRARKDNIFQKAGKFGFTRKVAKDGHPENL